ncbi:MAG: sulfite exporter TauE/SafE family protein [Pseudomonadota bacterium]
MESFANIGMFALAAGAAMFAGISKGGFGSSAAFVSSAVLALAIDPALALAIMLPVLMAIDISALRPYWRTWNAASARGLILGAIPGIGLGATLLAVISADALRVIIGAVALAFPVVQLARARGWLSPPQRDYGPVPAYGYGALAGFTSFVSHAGGPPVAMYLLGRPGIDKAEFQGTTVIVFWAINAAKAAVYAVMGLFTVQSLGASALLVPFAICGAWLGVRAHHAVPDRVFFAIAYALLVVTGARLIWVGLT